MRATQAMKNLEDCRELGYKAARRSRAVMTVPRLIAVVAAAGLVWLLLL